MGYDRDRRFQEIDKNDTERGGDEENIPRLPFAAKPPFPPIIQVYFCFARLLVHPREKGRDVAIEKGGKERKGMEMRQGPKAKKRREGRGEKREKAISNVRGFRRVLIIIFFPLPPSSHFSGSAYCPGRKGKGKREGVQSQFRSSCLSITSQWEGGRRRGRPLSMVPTAGRGCE